MGESEGSERSQGMGKGTGSKSHMNKSITMILAREVSVLPRKLKLWILAWGGGGGGVGGGRSGSKMRFELKKR